MGGRGGSSGIGPSGRTTVEDLSSRLEKIGARANRWQKYENDRLYVEYDNKKWYIDLKDKDNPVALYGPGVKGNIMRIARALDAAGIKYKKMESTYDEKIRLQKGITDAQPRPRKSPHEAKMDRISKHLETAGNKVQAGYGKRAAQNVMSLNEKEIKAMLERSPKGTPSYNYVESAYKYLKKEGYYRK